MKKFASGIHSLISKENKYLLLKRNASDKYDPGSWDLPGGGIDFGEQPLEAIIRETKEETGVDITVGKILYTWGMPSDDVWSIETYIEGLYIRGEIVLSHEHSEFVWVTKEELQNIEPKSIHLKKILKYT